MNAHEKTFEGTELKYLLEIESSGFNMETDYFEITLRRGEKELKFKRDDLVAEPYTVVVDNISIEKHHYYVCFDTAYFGPGPITAIVVALVPDSDFAAGTRKIVDKFLLTNVDEV